MGWLVPADLVAHHRATYYESSEPGSYDEEYRLAMRYDYVVIDWATNNLNWTDVALHAKKVKDAPAPDYQEGWLNGPKRIVLV